jgi:DNA-directed RNA polymerase I, II, and III subunit RPABC5|tara:strand:+ start:5409 stop:5621 length:213 start_codon:yes stop_codon:yes gene_type:complete
MIIPVKCFTCGKVIGNKYKVYLEMLEEEEEKVRYLNTENVKKTKEGLALDKLDLKDICCRRHFLTHVDII